jgi:hypothetical protein
MKALISPNETFNINWISSWVLENEQWVPVFSEIIDCFRVAQVETDENVFEVAPPLFWVNCPEDCKADQWYYKDGFIYVKPIDALQPN